MPVPADVPSASQHATDIPSTQQLAADVPSTQQLAAVVSQLQSLSALLHFLPATLALPATGAAALPLPRIYYGGGDPLLARMGETWADALATARSVWGGLLDDVRASQVWTKAQQAWIQGRGSSSKRALRRSSSSSAAGEDSRGGALGGSGGSAVSASSGNARGRRMLADVGERRGAAAVADALRVWLGLPASRELLRHAHARCAPSAELVLMLGRAQLAVARAAAAARDCDGGAAALHAWAGAAQRIREDGLPEALVCLADVLSAEWQLPQL